MSFVVSAAPKPTVERRGTDWKVWGLIFATVMLFGGQASQTERLKDLEAKIAARGKPTQTEALHGLYFPLSIPNVLHCNIKSSSCSC